VDVVISPRRVARILAIVAVGLAIASLAGQFSKYVLGHDQLRGFVPMFDLDRENNVPTWFQVAQLLLSSFLVATIARSKRKARDRYARHWRALSIIFLYLAVDEAFVIHEKTIEPLRAALHATGVLYYTWVILGAAFVVVVGIAYLRFLAHLNGETRRQFLFAGFLYVGGALGVELVNGWYADRYGDDNFPYAILTTIEESMEMLGIVVFLYALLTYLSAAADGVRILIQREGTTSPIDRT
jgi:hypothetical protein